MPTSVTLTIKLLSNCCNHLDIQVGTWDSRKLDKKLDYDAKNGLYLSAKAELFVSLGLTSELCDIGHNFLKSFRYALAHLSSSGMGGPQEDVDTQAVG
jgi:hypothetical protein